MYPAHLVRVSDAEREAFVAQLSAATAEGRLTLDEFSDRTQRAYAARTWGELVSLVADLPKVTAPAAGPPPRAVAGGQGITLSVIAMILGILSIVAIGLVPLGGIAGAIAVVLGILGSRAADRGEPSHRGFALAGMIFGSFGVLLSVAWTAFLVVLG